MFCSWTRDNVSASVRGRIMTKMAETARRLVAIFAADVEGFSRLMRNDEVATLRDLTERRRILEGLITSHRGRIANTAGDSVLAEFSSAVDAVQCAVEAQSASAEANRQMSPERHIKFRIGVHVGDVMVKAGDLFGDGVNIAARLQSSAAAEGISISAATDDHVRKVLPLTFVDLGMQSLKNIEPIRAYAVIVAAEPSRAGSLVDVGQSLTLPDRPSIAVLPFQNMSGDPEQEYFADGMVKDIITALSRFRNLFVIARNSSFTYKNRAVNIRQVGRDLGVRYVLEGSVRKAADRVRITGQLIDASTGAHLWADHFDGELKDIFDLQDDVATKVVGAIAPKMEQAEVARANRKPTESLDAYDCFLRGTENLHRQTLEGVGEAQRLLKKAIQLDPGYAAAYGSAAYCYAMRKANGWVTHRAQDIAEASRFGRTAVELGSDDALALARAGHAVAYVAEDLDAGARIIDRALELNPNLALAWFHSGWLRIWLGHPDTSIQHFARFRRMSPVDPLLIRANSGIAFAHVLAGRYDEASSYAEQALSENPDSHQALRMAAMSHALAGRMERAQTAMGRLRQIAPALRVSNLGDLTPLRRPEDMTRYAEGLRKAGLPE
jgi:TolB-like protein/class 3 adenylate cyclase/Tfp pilus assembly protein PilF